SGYIGTAAQAASQTIDLGLLGTLLAAQHCDGTPSFLKQDQVPAATHVDSRDSGADKGKTRTYEGTSSGGPLTIGFGREEAMAVKDPKGQATTTLGIASLPGVIDARGGVARTETGIVGGATRVARASVDVADIDLFGGVIKLSHLKWSA